MTRSRNFSWHELILTASFFFITTISFAQEKIPTLDDAKQTALQATRNSIIVETGDTLFEIAFRNGVSLTELAKINGLIEPYTIRVGQSLRLPANKDVSVGVSRKYSGIVVDAATGDTIYSYQADASRYPASLVKIMTIYLIFEALEEESLSMNTLIQISEFAASRPPSKLGIKAGKFISVRDAIRALIVKSANDVATAIAEHLGGTEENFAKIMTDKAVILGMGKSSFKNASGLTADGQTTTARDMAKLAIALQSQFPQYYHYFSTRTFKYGKRRFANHNRLLGRVPGVDGLKTGYTRASGYNIVASRKHGGQRYIAVVMGELTGNRRNIQTTQLLNDYAVNNSSKDPIGKLIGNLLVESDSQPEINNSDAIDNMIQNLTVPQNSETIPTPYKKPQEIPKSYVSSKLVCEIQHTLHNLGLYSGEADGLFGSETHKSILKYQELAGLLPDGEASYSLLSNLKATYAVATAENRDQPSDKNKWFSPFDSKKKCD